MTEPLWRHRLPENVFLLAIVAWAAYVLVEAARYESLLAWAFPAIVTVPLVVLCVAKLAHNLTDSDALGRVMFQDTETGDRPGTRHEAALFVGTIALYLALATLLNFFLAMPVFLFAFFRGFALYSTLRSAVTAFVIWVFVSFVFGTVFAVSGVSFGPFSWFELGLFG